MGIDWAKMDIAKQFLKKLLWCEEYGDYLIFVKSIQENLAEIFDVVCTLFLFTKTR